MNATLPPTGSMGRRRLAAKHAYGCCGPAHRADQPARDAKLHDKATLRQQGLPVWRAFLKRITGGDAALESYLQRVAGYGLTGCTKEQALFFGHGEGGNGKGTYLNTVAHADGGLRHKCDYGDRRSRYRRHPTELAMLRGARLVTAQETRGAELGRKPDQGPHWRRPNTLVSCTRTILPTFRRYRCFLQATTNPPADCGRSYPSPVQHGSVHRSHTSRRTRP